MPLKRNYLTSIELKDCLLTLSSALAKSIIVPEELHLIRAALQQETSNTGISSPSTEEEIEYSILKNLFNLMTLYFIDNHEDTNKSILHYRDYGLWNSRIVEDLRQAADMNINQSLFPKDIIILLAFAFDLCPAGLQDGLGIQTHAQRYQLLAPIFPSAAEVYPQATVTAAATQVAASADETVSAINFPYGNSEVANFLNTLHLIQVKQLGRIGTNYAINIDELSAEHEQSASIIKEASEYIDPNTPESFLLEYDKSVHATLWNMELALFHSIEDNELHEAIAEMFSTLDKLLNDVPAMYLISQFYREGRCDTFIKLMNNLVIAKGYTMARQDIETLMRLLEFNRGFFPKSPLNVRLSSHIQFHIYTYNYNCPEDLQPVAGQQTLHHNGNNRQYFSALTDLAYFTREQSALIKYYDVAFSGTSSTLTYSKRNDIDPSRAPGPNEIDFSLPKVNGLLKLTVTNKQNAILMICDVADYLFLANLMFMPQPELIVNTNACVRFLCEALAPLGFKKSPSGHHIDDLFDIKKRCENALRVSAQKVAPDTKPDAIVDYLNLTGKIQSVATSWLHNVACVMDGYRNSKLFIYLLHNIGQRLSNDQLTGPELDGYINVFSAWFRETPREQERMLMCHYSLLSQAVPPLIKFKKYETLDICLSALMQIVDILAEVPGFIEEFEGRNEFLVASKKIVDFIRVLESQKIDEWASPSGPKIKAKSAKAKKRSKVDELEVSLKLHKLNDELDVQKIGDFPTVIKPDNDIAPYLREKLLAFRTKLDALYRTRQSRAYAWLSGLITVLEGNHAPELAASQITDSQDTTPQQAEPAESVEALTKAIEGSAGAQKETSKANQANAVPFEQRISQLFKTQLQTTKQRPGRIRFTKQLSKCLDSLQTEKQRVAALKLSFNHMMRIINDTKQQQNTDHYYHLIKMLVETLNKGGTSYRSTIDAHFELYIRVLTLQSITDDKEINKLNLLKIYFAHSPQREPKFLEEIPGPTLPDGMDFGEIPTNFRPHIEQLAEEAHTHQDELDAEIKAAEEAEAARLAEEARLIAEAEQRAQEEAEAARLAAEAAAEAEKRQAQEKAVPFRKGRRNRRRPKKQPAAKAQAQAHANTEESPSTDKQEAFTPDDNAFPELLSPANPHTLFSGYRRPAKKLIQIPDKLDAYLRELLDASNYNSLYLVGGATRDILLGKQPADYDFVCTQPLPALMNNLGRKDVEHAPRGTDQHQQLHFTFIDDREYEIEISFVPLAELEEDARQRDLTINAIYQKMGGKNTDEPLDPTSRGLQDVQDKVLRFMGDVEEILTADPSKLLRLLKMQARLPDFTLDTDLGNYLEKRRFDRTVSTFILSHPFHDQIRAKSRLRTQLLNQVLSQPNAFDILRLMNQHGVNPVFNQEFQIPSNLEEYQSLSASFAQDLNPQERFCYFFIDHILDLQGRLPNYHFAETLSALRATFWYPPQEDALMRQVIMHLITGSTPPNYQELAEQFPHLQDYVARYSEKCEQVRRESFSPPLY